MSITADYTKSLKQEMNKFTYRFITIPIILHDKKAQDKLEEMGIDMDSELLTVKAKFDASRIECWYSTVKDGEELIEENLMYTEFTMQSNGTYVCPMDIEKFEELLNSQH